MTVQIGAVILFGFLIVALSTYQATVVPDQNREVEFLHNQEVQTDMVELSSSVAATGRTGDAAPATVSLGTRYPSRALFVNPPPASGTLRTVPPPGDGNVSLDGVDVRSSVDGEANDYWSDAANRNKSTRFIVYEPRYSRYREAPTTRLESGVAFDNFSRDRNITLTEQSVVEGDRITLLAVSGELRRNGVETASIDPGSISSVSRRERVSGELTVTIPTTLDNETWGELLSDEIANGWVNGTRQVGADRVAIDLNDSRTYSLGIAAVQVGSGTAPEPKAAYTDVERAPSEASVGSTREVVVEVRDEYGNPAEDVTVAAEDAAGIGSFAESNVSTDGDGRAVFEYTAESTGTADLRFSYEGLGSFDETTAADANVSVTVNRGGGGAGSINPPNSVVLTDSYRKEKNVSVAVLELVNRGSETVESSRARISFFAASGQDPPPEAVLTTADESPTLEVAGSLKNATIQFPPNETKYVCYEYGRDLGEDEFFVTAYEFDNGLNEQYFVGLDRKKTATCSENAVAYDDANGNGEYDDGETTYTESDFDANGEEADFSEKNITLEENITVSKLDLDAGSFTAQDVRIETTSDELKMVVDGDLDLRGSTLRATNGSVISLKASQGSGESDIDIRDARLVSDSVMTASTPGGGLRFNQGEPGTRIEEPIDENGQTLELNSGTKQGENGVDQPENGEII
ncbi:hypothetical protein BRC97_06815 [Halobacteriales archaeon QS_6_71_20]|nr:MAG: hypothetical protein BRC97_06815 [Halobacteriales archaeon QS_6_71_20]